MSESTPGFDWLPRVPDQPQDTATHRSSSHATLTDVRQTGADMSVGAQRPPLQVQREVLTQRASSPDAVTVVMPHAVTRAARRTRSLRAWMLTMPVDFAAMLAPLAWATHHWKGTIFAAFLTVVIFATGGLYRGRRHMSILDELPSLIGRLLVAAAVVAVIFSQRHDTESYVNGFLHIVVISAGLVLVGRAFTRWVVLLARRRRLGGAWRADRGQRAGRGRARPIAASLSAVRPALCRLHRG